MAKSDPTLSSIVQSKKLRKSRLFQDLSECPNPTPIIKKDKTLLGCRKRTCAFLGCRELWAEKRYKMLCQAHNIDAFTHRLRITPPKKMLPYQALHFVRQCQNCMRHWIKEHPGERFDMVLFPDKHGRSRLHWHGVVRCSLNAEKEWRAQMLRRRKKAVFTYSLRPLEDWKYQIKYAVGFTYQDEIEIVSVKGARIVVTLGKPWVFTQCCIYKMMKEWWRIYPRLFFIKK